MRFLVLCLWLSWCAMAHAATTTCPGAVAGQPQVYWGDLHVHTGYSLDAWGYGTAGNPAEAYAFARGGAARMADGREVRLQRPLDFMAVTDHAEWFNLMHLCTDPQGSEHPYCDVLTEKNTPTTGGEVFANYVIPTITRAIPEPTPLCQEQADNCRQAYLSQWQRVQEQANQADVPCEFTALIGYEWSATPDFSHNHRNVIFASDQVMADPADYMRFPTPPELWQELERQCRPEDGCDVIAIPHNTNMGDGKSFDVETESPFELAQRARYERLIEIHQEKGNSECLPAFGSSDEDCSFERYLTLASRSAEPSDFSEAQWQRTRGGYVRGLLLRGLRSYAATGNQVNPLQLGIIGSTDNHAGTGGFVDEEHWPGTVFGLGDFEQAMTRVDWNPGGLVAVWAEENTRASIFAALKRREVYASSGPRMRVRLQAATTPLSCDSAISAGVPMGGTLTRTDRINLLIQVEADQVPLARVEIISGTFANGELQERVQTVWQSDQGAATACVTHAETNFDQSAPAFWYARVKQVATPRWSAYHCRRAGRCDAFPQADRWIQERAWTSPVWFLPEPVQ